MTDEEIKAQIKELSLQIENEPENGELYLQRRDLHNRLQWYERGALDHYKWKEFRKDSPLPKN